MTDVAAEAGEMMQDFLNRITVLKNVFEVQLTALAWKLAAEVMKAEMPTTFAVGSLSWKNKPERTKVVVPVPKKPSGPMKVTILGPKPKERAERFQALLGRRIGKWARRDGKVQYTCVDKAGAFYTMRRVDDGVEKKVKFASIVADWIYIQ
jgi:hypothetical protein